MFISTLFKNNSSTVMQWTSRGTWHTPQGVLAVHGPISGFKVWHGCGRRLIVDLLLWGGEVVDLTSACLSCTLVTVNMWYVQSDVNNIKHCCNLYFGYKTVMCLNLCMLLNNLIYERNINSCNSDHVFWVFFSWRLNFLFSFEFIDSFDFIWNWIWNFPVWIAGNKLFFKNLMFISKILFLNFLLY